MIKQRKLHVSFAGAVIVGGHDLEIYFPSIDAAKKKPAADGPRPA
jgi:hypothetical protein